MCGVAFVILACSCRLRKLDPEEEDDPFNNYEVQSEAKLESFPHTGPHRLSLDSATFMGSGRDRTTWSFSAGMSSSRHLVPCLGSVLGEWFWVDFKRFYLFIFREGEGRKRGRETPMCERNIDQLPLAPGPQPRCVP